MKEYTAVFALAPNGSCSDTSSKTDCMMHNTWVKYSNGDEKCCRHIIQLNVDTRNPKLPSELFVQADGMAEVTQIDNDPSSLLYLNINDNVNNSSMCGDCNFASDAITYHSIPRLDDTTCCEPQFPQPTTDPKQGIFNVFITGGPFD